MLQNIVFFTHYQFNFMLKHKHIYHFSFQDIAKLTESNQFKKSNRQALKCQFFSRILYRSDGGGYNSVNSWFFIN